MAGIAWYAEKMGMPLDRRREELFERYAGILLRGNEVMNLTAITDPGEIALRHFADSIAVIPYLKAAGGGSTAGMCIADLGTGAGFPGIPLRIMLPDIRLTLIDSLRKRIGFLEAAAGELGLTGIRMIHARAEDAGRDPSLRGSFDAVIARAVAPLPVLCEYCLPLVRTGGFFAAMKSDIREEREAAAHAIAVLGGTEEALHEYSLPGSDLYRTLLIVRKTGATPAGYPRKAGKPEKEPLSGSLISDSPHPAGRFTDGSRDAAGTKETR